MKIHEFDPLKEPRYPEAIRRVCELADVDRAGVFLFDAGSGYLQGLIGLDDDGELEYLGGQIYRPYNDPENAPLQGVANRQIPYWLNNESEADGPDGTSLQYGQAIVPIEWEGEIIGILAVDRRLSFRPISPEEIPHIQSVASGIASILESVQVSRPPDLMMHVVNALSNGVCIIGTCGWILHCNEAMSRIYGYTPEYIKSVHMHSLFYPHREDWTTDPIWEDFHACTNTDWTGEMLNQRADGTLVPVRLKLVRLFPDSSFCCMVGVVEDLTQERALAEAERRKAELEGVLKVNRALQHEINNPLQAIMGSLQLIEMRDQVTEGGAPMLEQALRATEELAGVIRRMQAITRVRTKDSAVGPMLDTVASSAPSETEKNREEIASDDPLPASSVRR